MYVCRLTDPCNPHKKGCWWGGGAGRLFFKTPCSLHGRPENKSPSGTGVRKIKNGYRFEMPHSGTAGRPYRCVSVNPHRDVSVWSTAAGSNSAPLYTLPVGLHCIDSSLAPLPHPSSPTCFSPSPSLASPDFLIPLTPRVDNTYPWLMIIHPHHGLGAFYRRGDEGGERVSFTLSLFPAVSFTQLTPADWGKRHRRELR